MMLTVFLLRWPTFDVTLWNVDEAIHAAAATQLLDGGVMYRDAVDIRNPLSYYAVAAVFLVAGDNNLTAVRVALAVMIALTALAVMLAGRGSRHPSTGLWAAAVFLALSTNLVDASDSFAFHTEWFLIFFSACAACVFIRALEQPKGWLFALTGVLLGLAFLSKQPALLELAAPLVAIAFLGAFAGWTAARALRAAAFVVCGFIAMVGVVFLAFAIAGALDDLWFYTWTFNLRYYSGDLGIARRLGNALIELEVHFRRYWPIAVAVLTGGVLSVTRLLKAGRSGAMTVAGASAVYVLIWAVASTGGAASGGRGFGHYFFQILPAFSLLAGETLGTLFTWTRKLCGERRFMLAAGTGIPLLACAASLVIGSFQARTVQFPPEDPALRASAFVKSLTSPDERIFVWGFNPDIHLYSERKPASRFTFCSFQTGLIPWINADPGVDTSYAIVPGSMETLLGDLEATRPAFVIDCSAGLHRRVTKYPTKNFPELQSFLDRNYVVVEAGQFVPQGFRLHLIRDSFRLRPEARSVATLPPAGPAPELIAPSEADSGSPRPVEIIVVARGGDAGLRGVQLVINGNVHSGISFQSAPLMTAYFEVSFKELGPGKHAITARSRFADGSVAESPGQIVDAELRSVAPGLLAEFSVPSDAGALLPLEVSAPFGPAARETAGLRVFDLHAPSALVLALPRGATRIRGGFGIHEGAYATDNRAPTDGAEFSIVASGKGDSREVLLRRLLQPATEAADRGTQAFSLELPSTVQGERLELLINRGPVGNGASDWTYWSDLVVDTRKE